MRDAPIEDGPSHRAGEGGEMGSAKKICAVALMALGVLALVYKGFSYTKETHKADLGPLEFKVKERERVEVPTWLGVVLIAAGGALLLIPGRKR